MRILAAEPVVYPHLIGQVRGAGGVRQVAAAVEPRGCHVGEARMCGWSGEPLEFAARVQPGRQPARHKGTPGGRLLHRPERPGVLHPVAAAAPTEPDVEATRAVTDHATADVNRRHSEAAVSHLMASPHNFPAHGRVLTHALLRRPHRPSRRLAGWRGDVAAAVALKQPHGAAQVRHG